MARWQPPLVYCSTSHHPHAERPERPPPPKKRKPHVDTHEGLEHISGQVDDLREALMGANEQNQRELKEIRALLTKLLGNT